MSIWLALDRFSFHFSQASQSGGQDGHPPYWPHCFVVRLNGLHGCKSNKSTSHLLPSYAQLAVSFLGLCFFPLPLIYTMGLGAALSLTITMIVNLTLTPALLLAFPSFFADFGYLGFGCCIPAALQRWCLRSRSERGRERARRPQLVWLTLDWFGAAIRADFSLM